MRNQTTQHTHTIELEDDNMSLILDFERVFQPIVLTVDEINNNLPKPPFTETTNIKKVFLKIKDYNIEITDKIGNVPMDYLTDICYKSKS